MDINNLLQLNTDTVTKDVTMTTKADGSPDVVFVIVGPDSQAYRAEQARQRIEGTKRRAQQGKKKVDLTRDADAAELEAAVQSNMLNTACAVVVGWRGLMNGDQPAAFDPAAVRALLEKFPAWRDAVLAAVEVEADFLPQPAAT